MTMTITAYTDVRSPYTFVAKAEVYQWEEDFGVNVDWWPYAAPLEECSGPPRAAMNASFGRSSTCT
jgi:2-hydroxychromene-2-carboxylate isomerase